MTWRTRLCSPCLFGHAAHPLLTMVRGVAHHECRRCQADLGAVLGAVRVKKPPKRKAVVLTMAKQRRA